MTGVSPARMQSLLAAEFERHGWEWDLGAGRTIVQEIERHGTVNAERLAQRVPGDFLARNHTDRAELAMVIGAALGSTVPAAPPPAATTTLVIHGSQYNVTVGANSANSPITVGGTHINVEVATSKGEVLDAVAALVRAGLTLRWDADAASALGEAIESRNDIRYEDVQGRTEEVVRAEAPTRERAKAFLEKVAAGGLGGALGTGIAAGVAEALTQLPL